MTALTTQSTTPATVPSGTAIAADQVGTANAPATGDRIQYVKPDVGASGASDPVTRTNGMPIVAVDKATSGNISATDANNGAAVLGSASLFNAAPTANSFIALNVEGMSSAEVMGLGSGWTGNCYIEGSLDSTTGSDGSWTGILFANRANPPTQQHYVNGPGVRYHGPVGTLKWLRLRCQGGIAAGPIPVVLRASLAPAGLELVAPLPGGGNAIGTVSITNAPAQAKGTQASFAMPVQDMKDTGRNTRIFMLDAITAAPVAEALATVVQWYSNAAVAGTTQPAVVPAGKTLRLTGYKIQYQSLATVGYAVVRVRFNTGGVAVLASPLVASFEAGSGSGATTAAMTGGVTTETGSFPEGLELPAGGGIGFSVAGYGPTGTLTLEGGVRFEVHGYEY